MHEAHGGAWGRKNAPSRREQTRNNECAAGQPRGRGERAPPASYGSGGDNRRAHAQGVRHAGARASLNPIVRAIPQWSSLQRRCHCAHTAQE